MLESNKYEQQPVWYSYAVLAMYLEMYYLKSFDLKKLDTYRRVFENASKYFRRRGYPNENKIIGTGLTGVKNIEKELALQRVKR